MKNIYTCRLARLISPIVACSRLRDSRVRGFEKVRKRKKNGWKLLLFSRAAPIFPRPTISRLPHYLRAWNRLAQWDLYESTVDDFFASSTLLFAILKIDNRKPYPRWHTAPRSKGDRKGDRRLSSEGRSRHKRPEFPIVSRSCESSVSWFAVYRMCNETVTRSK